jgi:hypothetical protein
MRVCIFYQGARERSNRERGRERETTLLRKGINNTVLFGQCVSRKTRIPFALKEERFRDHLYLESERESE